MTAPQWRPRRCADVQLATLDDEAVLYHPARKTALALNATASSIWQLCDGERTLIEIIDLAKARKRLRPKKLEPPTIVKRLAQAEEWQRQLDTGDVKHRAEISRREGVSRARVTQIMELLEVHHRILDYVSTLGPETPERLVTERKLRKLTRLPLQDQLDSACFVWPDLRDFANGVSQRKGARSESYLAFLSKS